MPGSNKVTFLKDIAGLLLGLVLLSGAGRLVLLLVVGRLSVCLPACLSVCLSVYAARPSAPPPIPRPSARPPARPSARPNPTRPVPTRSDPTRLIYYNK